MSIAQADLSGFLDEAYTRIQPDQVFDGVFAHNWQKNGSKWRGKCPWHESKSGTAFYLDTKSLTWRCPSCDRGGGPLQYLHQVNGGHGSPKGKQFVELARVLGDLAGLPFPARELTDEQREHIQKLENRRSMLETVISFCHRLLLTESTQAIAYLTKERGFTIDDIKALKLGIFPPAKRVADLLTGQFAIEDAIECGLLYEKEPNVFGSQLAGYIVVPWNDEHGRPLTLYGRWHSKTPPEGRPKTTALRNPGKGENTWLRSKRSPLYLDRALAANHRELVVVEGVFDAAILQAKGDTSVIAWVAANPSEEQIETLRRGRVESVTFCLDPDGAGEKGTRQGVKHLTKAGIKTFVAPVLPDKQDPDEYTIAHGLEAWKAHINQRVHGFRYEAQQIVDELKPLNDAAKQKVIEQAEAFARSVPSSLQHALKPFFWHEIKELTGIETTTDEKTEASPEALKQAVAELETIVDPFERVLTENKIGETFKVRGAKLERLMGMRHQTNEPKVFAMSDLVSNLFYEVEERSQTGAPLGMQSGYYDLDAMTQGFQRSDLIIVAGRPSMGKTSFTLNVMQNIATFHKQPVLFFSMEMSKEQLTYRMAAAMSRIESGRLKAGRVQPNEWEALARAIDQLSGLPMHVDETVNPSVAYMQQKAMEVQEKHGEICAIALDYLQLMDGGSDNRVQELSRITRSLKAMAKEFNCPVLALSQLSRNVESRTNKRPMMADLRESGAIEQDADLIVMLYRDSYYNPDSVDKGIAEIIISKHRNGPTGTVKLLFEDQFTQFRNLAGPSRGN